MTVKKLEEQNGPIREAAKGRGGSNLYRSEGAVPAPLAFRDFFPAKANFRTRSLASIANSRVKSKGLSRAS